MKRLIVVGLWCVHPDYEKRPTMREVVLALGFQGLVPEIPKKRPMPVFPNVGVALAVDSIMLIPFPLLVLVLFLVDNSFWRIW